MSVWNQTWDEWRLWGPGYGWSTRYTATCKITVTRSIGSDTATVKVETTITTPSGDNSLGDWQCIPTINGATSGGGEKNIVVATAGYHAANSTHSATQTFTVGVGVSAGTLSGTVKFRIGGYAGYQGEYSDEKSWSLSYDSKGTPSQATWSNYYWGKESTVTIQRTVPAFRESVYLVWSDNTTITLRTYTQTDTTTVKYTIPYNACPTNAKTRVAKIRVETYNGSTQVGTWESANYTVALLTGDTTYLPTLTNNPVCEAYNDVVAALGTDTAVAQYSKLNVKAAKSDVSCKYSATIASRVVTFSNGSSASADQTNHISSLIQSAGTVSWTYTVTDSRGYTVTRTGTYTVINSSAPSITNVTVYRGDSGGTAQEGGAYIYATATASCESLGGHNSVTLKGKVDSGAYQSMTSGTRKTLKSDADANTQYLVTLTATDLLRSTSQTIIVPSLDLFLHIPSGKHGMGIGMKGTSDDTLRVGYDAKFYGGLVKHDSINNIDIDLVNAFEPIVAYGTNIPANANLNTASYANVGVYYRADSATVATFTNCPTTNAFTMIVRNVTKTDTDTSSKTWQYLVREITDINGNQFIQTAFSGATVGSGTFGSWVKKINRDDLTRIISSGDLNDYDSSKAGMYEVRSGISNSPLNWASLIVGGNAGSHQLIWNNTGMYFRSKTGSPLAWTVWKQVVTNTVEKNTYSNTNVKNGSLIARRQGNVVSINCPNDATSVTANTWVAYVKLGERYRPSETIYVPVGNAGTAFSRWVRIDTDGNVYLYTQQAVTSAQNFGFSTSYIVD